ncbi:diphthine--ammonia ligase [Candidatus Woesearchaeota archaeon]|nr:diphthine--ammonia ligase [Candidatus Woesearchaeota archaeon]
MKIADITKNNELIHEKEWNKLVDSLKKEKKLDFKKEFLKAVESRIPKKRFGILFSGGIDSTLIAFICKKLKADFVCYCVGLKDSPDIISAQEVAKKHNFRLKKKILSLKDIEKTIKTMVKLIGPDTMKVGVGSVIYEAIKLAKKDNIKDIFSGLGSEEIFAGYERHTLSKDINKECWKGLKDMHQRDFTRDFAIAKKLKVNVLVPFLDPKVISAAMQIPGKEKIRSGYKKYALRKSAEQLGLKKAWRKKKAAQYGSYFDKAILKLAKKHSFKYKKNYLNSLFNIGALVSSGKDSIYALHLMLKQDFNVKCMITLKSKNPDSYMFHTPAISMTKLQSKAIGIPLLEQTTRGEKEKELKDLKDALKKAKTKYKIQGISTGALFSNYQRERIEKIAQELNLKVFSPLWHMDQEAEMREILENKFKFIITKIAADGLDKTWLNKEITDKNIDKLVNLNKKIGFNIAGEGGEFETLMIDGPIFKKKIKIEKAEIKEESKIIAELIIKKAKLTNKSI